jgi:hypothetical protein
MLGALVAVAASACLGTGAALQVRPVSHPQAPSEQAWLTRFAANEARALGDPTVKTALVAPITADQARVVFQHRSRAYPGHTYLVVLHGSFVTPKMPCPEDAAGCGFRVEQLFGWQIMLASPTLGRVWHYFGIETDTPHLRAIPVGLRRIALPTDPAARPTGRLLRFAVAQALAMGGSQMRDLGFAPLSAAQASHLFGGIRTAGYLVMEHGLFRRAPGATTDRDPWFSWAALEFPQALDGRPMAFRALTRPRKFVRRVPGIQVNWTGLPLLRTTGHSFYWGGG